MAKILRVKKITHDMESRLSNVTLVSTQIKNLVKKLGTARATEFNAMKTQLTSNVNSAVGHLTNMIGSYNSLKSYIGLPDVTINRSACDSAVTNFIFNGEMLFNRDLVMRMTNVHREIAKMYDNTLSNMSNNAIANFKQWSKNKAFTVNINSASVTFTEISARVNWNSDNGESNPWQWGGSIELSNIPADEPIFQYKASYMGGGNYKAEIIGLHRNGNVIRNRIYCKDVDYNAYAYINVRLYPNKGIFYNNYGISAINSGVVWFGTQNFNLRVNASWTPKGNEYPFAPANGMSTMRGKDYNTMIGLLTSGVI